MPKSMMRTGESFSMDTCNERRRSRSRSRSDRRRRRRRRGR
jgi:hypothetical protein